MVRRQATLTDRPGATSRQPSAAPPTPARGWTRQLLWCGAIFALLLIAYWCNGSVLVGNDAKPNVYLPLSLLREGNLSFTPQEVPFMFSWRAKTQAGVQPINFGSWDASMSGYTTRQLVRMGVIYGPKPRYYITQSARNGPDGQPLYVSTFGPGAGLAALPVIAAARALGDVDNDGALMWNAAKLAAAMLVAGSAVFVFATARLYTTPLRSAVLALGYALGTCVWSISSQSLWQHGPNSFFLAMGSYFLLRGRRDGRWVWPLLCGLAYSAAVACRPTSVLVAVAAGAYLLAVSRRQLAMYVLGALPIALALAGYNHYYLGAPWRFGQAQAGRTVAMQKTGSEDLWSTPLLEGAAGLMVSPSRGLLVHSPVVLVAAAGLVLAARRRQWAMLPLLAATAGLWVIAFKWFDWWGGWCYGYRPLVDTMPLLAVLAIPAMDWLFARRWALAGAGVLLGWSVLVQVVGAFAYDVSSWNAGVDRFEVLLPGQKTPAVISDAQRLEEVLARYPGAQVNEIRLDIDEPRNRHRLWSVRNSQILYYLQNFSECCAKRREDSAIWVHQPSG